MAEAGNGEQTVDQEIVTEKTEILDKWLLALKEDLASWISRLLSIELTVDSFTSVLDTGVVLCRLANFIQNTGDKFFINNSGCVRQGIFPPCGLTFKEREASQGSFIARDNVCNFIRWCRELGVPDVIMFETEDLVSNKNEKAVLLTLLEVARKVFKFGVDPPELVRLENEIDKELENESEPTPSIKIEKVTALKKKHKSHSLDDLVFEVQKKCQCTTRYPVQRISEGKYRMGESKNLIFVRVMRKHVMVRVGGGWDTLDRYFEKHDPCRIIAHRKTSRPSRPSSAHQQQTHELLVRSPSSMSTASVSSTESYDSTSTAYSQMSVSSTPPRQAAVTKCGHSPRQRTLSGGRSSPTYDRCLSPTRGSHTRHKSPCQRSTPPRTIEAQGRLSNKSISMQDLKGRGSDSSGMVTNIPIPTKHRPSSARRSSATPANESPAKPAQGIPGQRRKSVAVSPRKDSSGAAVKQRQQSTTRTNYRDNSQARMHSRSRSMQDLNKYKLTGPLDNDTRSNKSRPTSARARSSSGAAERSANAASQRKTSTSQATRKMTNTTSCNSPRRRSPPNQQSPVNHSPRIQRRSSSTPRGSTYSPLSSPRVSRRQVSSHSREMQKTATVSSPGPMIRAISNLSSSSSTSYRMKRSASFDSKNDLSSQALNKEHLMGKYKDATKSPSKTQSSAAGARSPTKQSRVPIKIPGKQGTAKQHGQRVPTKPRSMAREERMATQNGREFYDDLPTPFDNYSYTAEEQASLVYNEDDIHLTENQSGLNLDFNKDFRQAYPSNSGGSTPDTVKTIDSFLGGTGETLSTTTSDYDFPDYDSDDISGLKSPHSIRSSLSVSPSPSKDLLESGDAEGRANVGIMQRLKSLNVEQSSINPTLRGKIFTPTETDGASILPDELHTKSFSSVEYSNKEPEERSKFFDIEKECLADASNGACDDADQLESPRTFSLVNALIGSIEKRNVPKKTIRVKKNTTTIENTIPVIRDLSTESRTGDEAMTGSCGTAQESGLVYSKFPSTIGSSASMETPFRCIMNAQQLDENDNLQVEGKPHQNDGISNGTKDIIAREDIEEMKIAGKMGSSKHDEE
ncbi:GAS2-like protein 1 [Actinia tenebrosa]|uniref:GAS2-like protein 1 n=1 Tax=Actinia tenebrosa TaxID=6105 RepID=A0A6P8HA60_ACTTE|nr:GAS2-like protein 1 [Actinia tenebrosa]